MGLDISVLTIFTKLNGVLWIISKIGANFVYKHNKSISAIQEGASALAVHIP